MFIILTSNPNPQITCSRYSGRDRTSNERMDVFKLVPQLVASEHYYLAGLGLFLGIMVYSKYSHVSVDESTDLAKSFHKLCNYRYLPIVCLKTIAECLRNIYLYDYYLSCGYSSSQMFMLGVVYVASLISNCAIGGFGDVNGRKYSCLIYCILSIVIVMLIAVPNYNFALLTMMILGWSSNLCNITFEAWFLGEHQKLGYYDFEIALLRDTFSNVYICTAMSALLAVLLGQFCIVQYGGTVAAILFSIFPYVIIILFLVSVWDENYGSNNRNNGGASITKLFGAFVTSYNIYTSDYKLMALSVAQSLHELSAILILMGLVTTNYYFDDNVSQMNRLLYVIVGFLIYSALGVALLKYKLNDRENIYQIPLFPHLSVLLLSIIALYSKSFVNFYLIIFAVVAGLVNPSYSVMKAEKLSEDTRCMCAHIFRAPLYIMLGVVLFFNVAVTSNYFTVSAIANILVFLCYRYYYSETVKEEMEEVTLQVGTLDYGIETGVGNVGNRVRNFSITRQTSELDVYLREYKSIA